MAKKMKSLLFDNGHENFVVNDDPTRIIRFNPADLEIINRVLDVQRHSKDYSPSEGIELNPDGTPESDMERDGTCVAEFSGEMRKAFNGVFLPDIYGTIFADQFPLCIIGQKYLYEGVLEGLLMLMKPAVGEYARKNRKKSRKYLENMGK